MFNKIFYKFHRILGSLLSILFVLWFFTGFVMIYHNFPKISDRERYSGYSPILIDNTTHIDSILEDVATLEHLNSVSIKAKTQGNVYIQYQSAGNHTIIYNDKEAPAERQSFDLISAYASNVNAAPIIRIDTVTKLDRWMPYDKQKADYPLYKFYFDDDDQSELYVSSLTGEGLQYTNSDSRFLAWIGAIPHWLYIANLRHYTDTWKAIVIGLSGVGSILCLTGIFLGSRAYIIRYKKKKELISPYKSVYKWHHITGFIFGIFVFTFAFSGMMSLQKVPQWIIKTENPKLENSFNDETLAISPLEYPLHYSTLIKEYTDKVQKIEWATFGNKPYYKVIINDSLYFVDASIKNEVKSLFLSENDVMNKIHGNNLMQIELMNDYDNYYLHKRYKYPLPVYKVTVEDPDKSLYYINPKTAEIRYYNSNTKTRKWMYQALHSFSVKWLLDRPVLWNAIMWTTMIGGALVSITGLWLSLKYLKRKNKKRKIRINSNQKNKNICQKEE